MRRELAGLEKKLEAANTAVEQRKNGSRRADGGPKWALIKKEALQMLEYKERELQDMREGEGRVKVGETLARLTEDVKAVGDQVAGLRDHLSNREEALADLRRQIQDEKRTR